MLKKMKLVRFLSIGTMLVLFAFSPLQAKTKVGFVYVGPVSDHGWTYQHDLGRQAVKKKFGNNVETTYVESVSEGADAERVIRKMAKNGHDIIFTTSFGYMNPTLKVAKQFSKVKFEHATGFKTHRNMGIYNARFYEGRYPVGVLAGKMTKSNIIGYVASFPIPEVVRGINATLLGARSVNPNVEIKVVWVSTWYDPGKEADAAKILIDQGADVIMQHTDSPAALQIAEERGVWAVGQASDMKKFAPKAQLTAIIDNWDLHYVNKVGQVIKGTWKQENLWNGLREGWVRLARLNDAIPKNIKTLVNKTVTDIKSGKLHPFQGPIKKQDGSLWVKKGAVLSDGELLGMNVYVEGIIGDLPK